METGREANIELDNVVNRILGSLAGIDAKAELRSHLTDAAGLAAQRDGRGLITGPDVRQAVADEGGEAALARAFGRTGPAERRTLGALVAFVGLRAAGALAGLVAAAVAIRNSGLAGVGAIVAILAVAATVLAIVAIVHVLGRRDLGRRARLVWIIALLLFEPVAGIVYFILDKATSRDLATRLFPEAEPA